MKIKYIILALILAASSASAQGVDTNNDGFTDAFAVSGANGVSKLLGINSGALKVVGEEGAPCSALRKGGWLYKPKSQDSGGTREGRPMIFITKKTPSASNLDVFTSNGQKLCTFKRFSKTNRFYAGTGTGCRVSPTKLASLANQASGEEKIYIRLNSSYCTTAINPKKRVDKRSGSATSLTTTP